MNFDLDAVVFGVAVALGAVSIPAVMSAWRGSKKLRPLPPNNKAPWKLIGNLTDLRIYPLKSGQGIDLKEAELTNLGLIQVANGSKKILLRDRYFMLFREDNGEMVTGRVYPKILQCKVTPESSDSVRISFSGKSDLIVRVPKDGKKITRMWKNESVQCLDCGDEAAEWITEIIKDSNRDITSRIRLGYWPSKDSKRDIINAWKGLDQIFKGTTNLDGGAFSDFTSYMLMISSSIDELNRRLQGVKVTHRQFRPNFYVQTDEPPFSDLKWKWVKIGENIFRVVKGCQRCVMTTFDPATSEKFPNNEPLNTLNRMEEAKCKYPIEESPMMGIHLGSYESGRVHTGDSVYVLT